MCAKQFTNSAYNQEQYLWDTFFFLAPYFYLEKPGKNTGFAKPANSPLFELGQKGHFCDIIRAILTDDERNGM